MFLPQFYKTVFIKQFYIYTISHTNVQIYSSPNINLQFYLQSHYKYATLFTIPNINIQLGDIKPNSEQQLLKQRVTPQYMYGFQDLIWLWIYTWFLGPFEFPSGLSTLINIQLHYMTSTSDVHCTVHYRKLSAAHNTPSLRSRQGDHLTGGGHFFACRPIVIKFARDV